MLFVTQFGDSNCAVIHVELGNTSCILTSNLSGIKWKGDKDKPK